MTGQRLERLLVRQLGECCEGDVEDRLRALEARADDAAGAAAVDVPALSTLGDDTRYTIARLLAAADRELCVCEIEPVVDVGDSAVSHALADLRGAGLVTRRKDGNWRYYEATERATAVLSALDATRGGDATDRGSGPATESESGAGLGSDSESGAGLESDSESGTGSGSETGTGTDV